MKTSFRLHFPCCCCSREGETFTSLQAALDRGLETGFEFACFEGSTLRASWTTFGGLRRSS